MDELLRLCALFHETSSPIPAPRDKRLFFRQLEDRLQSCGEVYAPPAADPIYGDAPFSAVTWNLERGKNLSSILKTLAAHPDLRSADFYFFTEVDWGMLRSGNRNVTAELGEALGCYAYFAPSYFNLTLGHGSERFLEGQNTFGLHGKALLSRRRLQNFRTVPLTNAYNKLKAKESRLGEKRALVAELEMDGRRLTLACAHLDAFSTPKVRARQLGLAATALSGSPSVLLAGDWNTNTLHSTRGPGLLAGLLRQILFTGPQAMIQTHFPRPELKFELPLFEMLRREGLDFEACNESGAGTYDLVSDDQDLGQMAHDRFPQWVLRWINRQIQKGGGQISLKLDWFASRGIHPLERRVLRLKAGVDYPEQDRPSDHHPVLLRFHLPHSE